jgi:hypothetical protein
MTSVWPPTGYPLESDTCILDDLVAACKLWGLVPGSRGKRVLSAIHFLSVSEIGKV